MCWLTVITAYAAIIANGAIVALSIKPVCDVDSLRLKWS